jgi:hypothetical protein
MRRYVSADSATDPTDSFHVSIRLAKDDRGDGIWIGAIASFRYTPLTPAAETS